MSNKFIILFVLFLSFSSTFSSKVFAAYAWEDLAFNKAEDEEWIMSELAESELIFFDPYYTDSELFYANSLYNSLGLDTAFSFYKMYTQNITYPDKKETQRKVKKPKTKAQQAGYSLARFFIITIGSYPITFMFTCAVVFPLTYQNSAWDYQRQMTWALLASLTASATIALVDMIVDLVIKDKKEKKLKAEKEALEKALVSMSDPNYLNPMLNTFVGLENANNSLGSKLARLQNL